MTTGIPIGLETCDGIMEGFARNGLGESMDCDYYGPDNVPEMVLLAESAF